jgi:hypothetical protein
MPVDKGHEDPEKWFLYPEEEISERYIVDRGKDEAKEEADCQQQATMPGLQKPWNIGGEYEYDREEVGSAAGNIHHKEGYQGG